MCIIYIGNDLTNNNNNKTYQADRIISPTVYEVPLKTSSKSNAVPDGIYSSRDEPSASAVACAYENPKASSIGCRLNLFESSSGNETADSNSQLHQAQYDFPSSERLGAKQPVTNPLPIKQETHGLEQSLKQEELQLLIEARATLERRRKAKGMVSH